MMVFDNLLVAHSTLPVQTQLNADEPERERMVHRVSRLLAPVDFSYRRNRYKEGLLGLPLMKQGSHRKVPTWRILSSRVTLFAALEIACGATSLQVASGRSSQ